MSSGLHLNILWPLGHLRGRAGGGVLGTRRSKSVKQQFLKYSRKIIVFFKKKPILTFYTERKVFPVPFPLTFCPFVRDVDAHKESGR